jgi:sugar (pentulose or hexulose) kinase
MNLLVGVDLGTTACKVTVVASDLTASSISSPPYPIAAPHREWAEQRSAYLGSGCRYDCAACAGQRGCRFA